MRVTLSTERIHAGAWYGWRKGGAVPRKIRELKAELRRTGFTDGRRRGKGSHSYWMYPGLGDAVTLSGGDADDARPYQERAVRRAIEAARALERGR